MEAQGKLSTHKANIGPIKEQKQVKGLQECPEYTRETHNYGEKR